MIYTLSFHNHPPPSLSRLHYSNDGLKVTVDTLSPFQRHFQPVYRISSVSLLWQHWTRTHALFDCSKWCTHNSSHIRLHNLLSICWNPLCDVSCAFTTSAGFHDYWSLPQFFESFHGIPRVNIVTSPIVHRMKRQWKWKILENLDDESAMLGAIS